LRCLDPEIGGRAIDGKSLAATVNKPISDGTDGPAAMFYAATLPAPPNLCGPTAPRLKWDAKEQAMGEHRSRRAFLKDGTLFLAVCGVLLGEAWAEEKPKLRLGLNK
jgi:hypothetical protein